MRNISYDECDSFDEVAKIFNTIVLPDLEQLNAKVTQLSNAIEAKKEKPKKEPAKAPALEPPEAAKKPAAKKAKKKKKAKKGSVKVRALIGLVIAVILAMVIGTVGAAYVATDITYDIASNPELLSTYLRDSIGTGVYTFTPQSAPGAVIEGKLYYDATANMLKVSTDGSTWTELGTTSAGTSLDGSYDLGYGITVDGTAVTLTVADGDDNSALIIAQDDATNDPNALEIVMGTGSIGAGIHIDSQSGGTDIKGDNWSINQAGLLTSVGVTSSSTITLANSETIINDTDGEIEFAGNGTEDVSFGFGTNNTLTWTTDTSVATVAWGDLDSHTGITDITGDAADFTLKITADAGGEDLIINQAGGVDASIQLLSAGTGADAIDIETSAGGIYIETTGATKDIHLDATAGSVTVDSGEAHANAIHLKTTNAAGGMNVDVGSGNLDIDVTGGDVTIDNDGAGKNITIDATAGSVYIDGGEAAANAIVIDASNAAGGIDVDAGTGNIDIDCTDGTVAIDNDGAGKDISLTSDAGRVVVTAEEAADNAITLVSAAGGIDMDSALSTVITSSEDTADSIQVTSSAGGIDVTAAGAAAEDLDLVCTSGSTNISGGEADAAAVTIAAGAGGIDITSAATFDIDITATGGRCLVVAGEAVADQIKLEATGTTTGDAINLKTTDGAIMLNADGGGNGDIELDAADDMTLTAAGDLTLAVTGTFKMGGALLANNKVTVVVDVDGRTITAAESGSVIVFTMTGAAATATLPDAAAGLWYILVDGNITGARDLTIDPQGADTINGAAAGNYIKCENDRDGEAVMIFAADGTDWYTVACGSSTVWTEE